MRVNTIAAFFVMMVGGAIAVSAGARSMIVNVEAAIAGPQVATPSSQSSSPEAQTATASSFPSRSDGDAAPQDSPTDTSRNSHAVREDTVADSM